MLNCGPFKLFRFISYISSNINLSITNEFNWSLDIRYSEAKLYVNMRTCLHSVRLVYNSLKTYDILDTPIFLCIILWQATPVWRGAPLDRPSIVSKTVRRPAFLALLWASKASPRLLLPVSTALWARIEKKHRINSPLINHCPMSSGVSEQASK